MEDKSRLWYTFHTNWHQTLVCPQKGQSCDSPHETEGRGILELKTLLPANNTIFTGNSYFNVHILEHNCNKLKATTLHATIKSSPLKCTTELAPFLLIYSKIAKLMWPCHCKPWPEEFKRIVLHFGPHVMKRKLDAHVSSSVLYARVMSRKWDWNVAPKLYQNSGNYGFKCSNILLQPIKPACLWIQGTTKEPLSYQYDIAHVSKKLSNYSLRNCSSSALVEGGSNQAVFNSTVLIVRNVLDCYLCTWQLHYVWAMGLKKSPFLYCYNYCLYL